MTSFRWPGRRRAAVSLTFDDARASQLDRAIPLLRRHGIKASFYISPRNVMYREDQWRAVAASGHEIGNHTYNHPCSGNYPWARGKALEDFTLERMRDELDAADTFIRQSLGITAETFAYPCGQAYVGRGKNRQSYVPLIAERFLVGRGCFQTTANAPEICDLAYVAGVQSDDTDFQRLWQQVELAIEHGAWLVLVSHDVGTAGRQSMPVEVLERLCRAIRQAEDHLWCDTVAVVGRAIRDGRIM